MKLPAVSGKDVLRALTRNGFQEVRSSGSHRFLKGPQGQRVVVPYHNSDLPKGTLKSILDQAGLTVDDLVAML